MSLKLDLLAALSMTPPGRKLVFRIIFERKGVYPESSETPDPNDPHVKARNKQAEEAKIGLAMLEKRPHETVSLTNSRGSRIQAIFVPSEKPSLCYCVLSHGYRCTGLREFAAYLPYYLGKNISLLIVDHQAHGESEGEVITYGAQEHIDLIQWINWLQDRFGKDIRVMLHGNSMGSATVMQCAGSPDLPPCVRQVVADCGYESMKSELLHCFGLFHVPEKAYPKIAERYKKFIGFEADTVNALESLRRAKIPVHLVHGTEDDFVPTDMSRRLHEALPDKTTLLLVPGAGHVESWQFGRESYQKLLDETIAAMDAGC